MGESKAWLDYDLYGNGTEVVLLHGFLESPSIWNSFIEASKSHFKLINIRLPNHDPLESKYFPADLDTQAEQLHYTLNQIGIHSPVLIGHSLGGYLALEYIKKYSPHTSGLALVNSTCFADDKEKKKQRNRAIRLMESHPKMFIQMAIKNLFKSNHHSIYQDTITHLIQEAQKLPTPAVQASLIAMRDRKSSCEFLKNYTKKKLLLSGKEDPLIPSSHSETMATHIKTLILESGHMSWLEDSESMVQALIRFLE